jgi:DNA-binding MarR family transcriptional regulator
MSSTPKTRPELIAALNTAMRDAGGQGVMYSHAVAQRLGINSTDLECLDLVVLRGPITAGALAAATGLTTGAITGVIDRLERAGFALRERDPDDRRKVLVRAQSSAVDRIAPMFEPMQRAAMTALAPYRDDELALLLDFFTRAHDASVAAMTELQTLPAPARRNAGAVKRRRRISPG